MTTTFSENDVRLLDKTISVRERLIDNLLTKPLPTASRDIDSFTNLLESVDRSVFGKAKIKIEDVNSKANEETKDMLRSLLLDLHRNNSNSPIGVLEVAEGGPVYKPNDMAVLEGELIPKIDSIDVKAILNR
jgi:hypothetical protein